MSRSVGSRRISKSSTSSSTRADVPLAAVATTPWRRRPDDAAGRARAPSGRSDSTAVSTVERPVHRHRLPADERAPGRRRRPRAPVGRRDRDRRRSQQQHARARQYVQPILPAGASCTDGRRSEAQTGSSRQRPSGITAGTSTPDDVIDRVERRIREFAELLLAAGSGA